MVRFTADQLAESTLRRQFPDPGEPSGRALLALFRSIGPVQSQVARAPFLAAASRLPGITYHAICAEFESYRLVKTTNLRGTVHTSPADDHQPLDTVARIGTTPILRRTLRLDDEVISELIKEVEAFCTPRWRTRVELCDHLHGWLIDRRLSTDGLPSAAARSLVWGHSGLIRRPGDAAWQKRTDIYHRTAAAVVDVDPVHDQQAALAELIMRHCAAYGPVHRTDLAFFFAVGLTQVDAAVTSLGSRIERHIGPDGEPLVDVAKPRGGGGSGDPGTRLLGEFDGLLLGFHSQHRMRFCTEQDLAVIWRKINAQFAPVVLHGGRLVATWRSVARGRRTDLEVTMLPGRRALPEDTFAEAAADVAMAMDYQLGDLRVLTRTE